MSTEMAARPPRLEDRLFPHETPQQLAAGGTLFDEEEPPRGIYLIHAGTIDLLFRTRSGDLKTLRREGAGGILGLEAVVSGRTHDQRA